MTTSRFCRDMKDWTDDELNEHYEMIKGVITNRTAFFGDEKLIDKAREAAAELKARNKKVA